MICIFDIETTGTENQRPISFAAMVYDENDPSKILKSCNIFMQPPEKILPGSTLIHGMTNDNLNQFSDKILPYEQGLLKIREFFVTLPDETYVSGYNIIEFDCKWLNHALHDAVNLEIDFNRFTLLDLFPICKKYFSVETTGNHRLDTMAYVCYPDRLDDIIKKRILHDAFTDCELTKDVLTFFIDTFESAEKILEFYKKPVYIEKMPFGKHKGKTLTEIFYTDRAYLSWVITKSDAGQKDPDLVYSIKTTIAHELAQLDQEDLIND